MDDLGPFSIPNTHSHDFVAKSNGQPYRVWVATPAKRVPGVLRPALYVTDANGQFGMVTEASRFLAFGAEIPPVIVVGVGYGGDSGFRDQMRLRNYELTPNSDEDYLKRAAEQGQPLDERGLGGAPGFLEFITLELAPFIETHYDADPADRGYFGYSLGGLFGAYALLREPPAFQRFILGSPSLWWNRAETLESEATRAEGSPQLPARVYISAGELEEAPGGPIPPWARMVSNALQFSNALASRGYEGLSLDFDIIRGVGHQAPPMLIQGLKSVYGAPRAKPTA